MRVARSSTVLSQIATAVLATICIACPAISRADEAVRLSWQDFAKDPKKVQSLRKGVAVMKARNTQDHNSPEYRKSWEYWANIHGYFGASSPFGTVAQNMRRLPSSERHFFDGITDMTPPDSVANDVWAHCQHSPRNGVNPWFFAWHRLYLLHFEKQLQASAEDSTLRLPYWDYTDPDQLAMPAAFTQPEYKDDAGATQPNPLFEPRRAPGWLSNEVSLETNSTNIDNYFKERQFLRYQSRVEANVHGYVHCSVAEGCPVPDMGAVPYSSNDPIFWLHHANIDRLWSCWGNIPGNKNPKDANFLNHSFSFVDANGEEVKSTVGQLFDGSIVDYKYENEGNCSRGSRISVAATDTGDAAPTIEKVADMTNSQITELLDQERSLNPPTAPVLLSAAQTKVTIPLRNEGDMSTLSSLALRDHATTPVATHLVLSGITFSAPPGVQFYVYLEDSANPAKREYAGTINFFGATPIGASQEGHMHAAGADATEGLTREFDVTDALRKLAGGKPDLNKITVSFEATNGRSGSRTTPEINSESHLTVKAIDFKVSAAQ